MYFYEKTFLVKIQKLAKIQYMYPLHVFTRRVAFLQPCSTVQVEVPEIFTFFFLQFDHFSPVFACYLCEDGQDQSLEGSSAMGMLGSLNGPGDEGGFNDSSSSLPVRTGMELLTRYCTSPSV